MSYGHQPTFGGIFTEEDNITNDFEIVFISRSKEMIKLKNLIKEQNKKSKYDLVMDLIDDFLELRDGFDTRMLEIEKKLKELKPQLSSSDNRLNPDDFDTDDYLQNKNGDNDE